jgi:hypothetical protein
MPPGFFQATLLQIKRKKYPSGLDMVYKIKYLWLEDMLKWDALRGGIMFKESTLIVLILPTAMKKG